MEYLGFLYLAYLYNLLFNFSKKKKNINLVFIKKDMICKKNIMTDFKEGHLVVFKLWKKSNPKLLK
jgi:hypothetical protein